MSIPLDDLNPDFRRKLEALLTRLKQQGVSMRVCTALRTPTEQARLWRQSRSRDEVLAAVMRLRSGGAPFLADVLDKAGPCSGPPVTKSLPGFSWHQWGEAADCFWLIDGAAEWSVTRVVGGDNGYHALARLAAEAGLTAGGNWPRFKDWPHVQLRPASSPLASGMSLIDMDKAMKKRFG